MAYISIKDAVVKRSFWDGKGLEVAEQFTRGNGEQGERKYSAFFDAPHNLTEGQKVNLSGLLGWKSRTWEKDGETFAATDITVNNPTVEVVGGGGSDLPW